MSNSTRIHPCPYCGTPTTNAIACSRHTDLPKLDPFYNPTARKHANEPDGRLHPRSAPAELSTQGR